MTTPVIDSFVALHGGQNSYADPLLLKPEEFARGVNMSIRGGLAKTRPGFVEETVPNMPTGVFQGADRWSLDGGDYIVFVVAGHVYAIAVDTNVLTDLGLLLDPTADQCWFCQADRYLVIQDGASAPVVLYEDTVPTVYAGEQSIPIGTVMYFVFQRLHVAVNDPGLMYFKSGDIFTPTTPASCLRFIEGEYWGTGGAHCLPLELGHIYGMDAFRNAATGTGVGTLLAFARNGVVAYDFSVPRLDWPEVNTAQVLFTNAGCKSPWSTLAVNDDLMYRGVDGLRTVRYTATSVGSSSGALSNLPMSLRVSTWFDSEVRSYLKYVSTAFWNNYALVTVAGTDTRYFQGIVALDTAATHALAGNSNPAFPGVWTGYSFAQVVNAERLGRNEVFVFVEGPRLLRLDEDATQDVDSAGESVNIESRLVTRSYNFGDAGMVKKLQHLDLWLSGIYVDSTISVYFRPTGYPKWCLMGSREVEAAAGYPGYRRRLRFSIEDATQFCNTMTKELLPVGTEFQFAIEIEGSATLERGLAHATREVEAPPDPCDVALSTGTLTGSDLDDWSYSAEGE